MGESEGPKITRREFLKWLVGITTGYAFIPPIFRIESDQQEPMPPMIKLPDNVMQACLDKLVAVRKEWNVDDKTPNRDVIFNSLGRTHGYTLAFLDGVPVAIRNYVPERIAVPATLGHTYIGRGRLDEENFVQFYGEEKSVAAIPLIIPLPPVSDYMDEIFDGLKSAYIEPRIPGSHGVTPGVSNDKPAPDVFLFQDMDPIVSNQTIRMPPDGVYQIRLKTFEDKTVGYSLQLIAGGPKLGVSEKNRSYIISPEMQQVKAPSLSGESK